MLNEIITLINNNKIEEAFNLLIQNEDSLGENSNYWAIRGFLTMKIGEYSLAAACYDNAINLGLIDADMFYNYGQISLELNNLSDAAIYFGLSYKYTDDQELKIEVTKLFGDNIYLKTIFDIACVGSNKHIIMLAGMGFGTNYQRPQQLARSFAKMGCRVSYIQPSTKFDVNTKNIDINILNEASKDIIKIDNVNIYTPFKATFGNTVVCDNYNGVIQSVIKNSPKDEEIIVISTIPEIHEVLEKIEGDFYFVYECVDDNTDTEYAFWGTNSTAYDERKAMDMADAVTTTATPLFLQYRDVEDRDNVYLSRNAVTESDFTIAEYPIPEDLKDIPEPRIFYMGALYDWLDIDMIKNVARRNKDKSFVFVGFGDTTVFGELEENMYYLGAKDHKELKNYLFNVQVGIIPFKDNTDLIISCDPIKQYEYIASGLPVISTYMPEAILNKPFSFFANTVEEFEACLEKALKADMKFDKIKNFVVKDSWHYRAAQIINIANGNEKIPSDLMTSIRKELDRANKLNNNPILTTIKAMTYSKEKPQEYMNIMRGIYNPNSLKYIERQYLTSLLKNNQMKEFLSVTSESSYVNNNLKKELASIFKNSHKNIFYTLAYLVVNNPVKAIEKAKNISDTKLRRFYLTYIYLSIGRKVSKDDMVLFYSHIKQGKSKLNFEDESQEDVDSNELYCLVNTTNSIDEKTISSLENLIGNIDYVCVCEKNTHTTRNCKDIGELTRIDNLTYIVFYNDNYVSEVRYLAENGVGACKILCIKNKEASFYNIDSNLMNHVKDKKYLNTLSVYKHNSADGNVEAILRNIPESMKRYNINLISKEDIWKMDTVIKVPLISSVTLSGFGTFLAYPKHTFNIELWHGGLNIKTCGLLDKSDKNSGGGVELFKNADVFCVPSQMTLLMYSAYFALPENKYEITGMARTDLLKTNTSRANLERILGKSIDNKKIIFNLPTFHIDESSGRTEGSSNLQDSFKINNFDYKKFDEFLEKHNAICISKVHHGEENIVIEKSRSRIYTNLHFISNLDMEKHSLNLYDVLGAGDLLITDYSSIYGDYIFMDKPIVFLNSDIDDYRKTRGIALEPYEFWTPGAKASNQNELESEIYNNFLNDKYYKKERDLVAPLFFKYMDFNASKRVWDVINNAFKKIK